MSKTNGSVTPNGSTLVNGNGTSNGNPFTNVKPAANGRNESNTQMRKDESLSAGISNLTVALNMRPITVTRKYRKDLGVVCGNVLCDTDSLEAFLDFIARDRLRHMPHKGSKKDKILRWAEYFGTQISEFHESVEQFVPNSVETAQLIWECCRILIQVGEQHLDGLDKVIGVFYKMSLQMSSILRNHKLFTSNAVTKDELAATYAELLEIVVEITMTYYRRSKTTSSLRVDDIDKLYGKRIDQFFYHRDQVSDTIWKWQLERNTDSRNITVSMGTIRRWLCPQDRTLRLLASDTMNSRGARDEFTCEWFQSHLLDFSRSSDQLLAITGGSGSGKSILSGWIAERLERALGGKTYVVNSIIIDSTLKSEATCLRILKRLLLQSLDQNVGNVHFYQHLSAALEMSTRASNVSEIEDALWLALDTALDVDYNIMIILDGIDQITNFKAVGHQFLGRLNNVCSKHRSHVKYIVLSNESQNAIKIPHRKFLLQPGEDLQKFIYNSLASYHHFHDRKEQDKKSIVQRIIDASKGNFVLADLSIQLLRREKNHDSFTHALNHIPRSISDAMEKLMAHLDLSTPDTKLMLSWLLVSERPLTLLEIQALLEVNISTKKRSRRFDVEDQIRQTCGPMVEVRDGIVHFRHVTIRQHLLELSKTGKTLIQLQHAHSDLTTRCLAYTNTHVTNSGDCAIDELESSKIDILFQKHHLLEYTSRYWTKHFSASSMFRKNGKHEITETLRHSFSGSVLLAQIERSCWETQSSVIDALEMHKLALSMRKTILTEAHEAVLQCIITIASTYQKISSTIEASTYYYQAAKLSRTIFGAHHTITTVCAETYLTCTQSIVVTKRTETTTCREEMLKVVITAHEHHHSTESVIRYKKLLAKLYIEIQEVTLATKVYREVYKACVEHYGEFHSETMTVSKGLTIVLQRGSRHEDVLTYVRSMYEEAERTMEIHDIRRINIMIRLVEIYESHKDFMESEELLVQYWRKISIACHSKHSVELHERKIEIALNYVRFLRRLSRYEEASGLLCGLWIEYEKEEIQSESLIIWIKTIGEELNELRILDVAIQVFTAVWGFYKRIHKQYCVEAISVAIILAKISIEIRTDESYSEETTCMEEEILREIYESTVKTITTTTITTTTVTTCETLSAFYFRTARWSEAITVCREVLKGLWPGVISCGKPSLPREFTSEAVEMTIRMAHCHLKEHQIEETEKLLCYVYQATKSHLRIQDELVSKTVRELVLFYEERNRPERVIEVYIELLEGYSRGLGKSHSLTLETLYRLGGLCVKHGRKDAEHYYLEIYTNLNKESGVCHHGAIEAALALTKIYEVEKRWESSEKIYKVLWQTITTCTKEYDITAERVDEIYQRYFYVLEKEMKTSYEVLRQITIEFREVCVHVYGVRAEITLKATLRLAEICERSDRHVHEAIQIYQGVCQETTTTVKTTTITTIITEAKSRLTNLYVVHSSTSTEYATKAIHLQMELFESTKSHYGCSHELTLKHLSELAVFYKSRNDQKLTMTVMETLKTTIIDIISTEKDSKRLFDCSTKIAKIYVSQGHTHEAYDILAELRLQIISRDTRNSEKCGFKFDQNIDRRSFVFLATFQECLKNTVHINFSEIMADFLVENIMHEAYTRSLTQKTVGFETIMAHGARLRYFRKGKYDTRDSRIDDELFEAFKLRMGSGIKTSTATTRYFFINVLLEEAGKSQHDVHLVKTGCVSGAAAVRVLLEQSKFQEANDLSNCILQFTISHHGFHDQEIINSGFKLALYLAGRGAQPCPEKDPRRKQMMDLSKTFVQEILEACRHIHVDFTKTGLPELNDLVTLLGTQQNYTDLEWLLTQLWNSRHETSWSAQSIIYIGRRLVEVRFTHGNDKLSAIHLWEDICYNVRRVWGPLDNTTLQMYTLLSELYTAAGQFEKAMGVHYEILRQEISDDNDTSPEDACDHASHHVDLLKRSYQRLGRLDKDQGTYADLLKELKTSFKGDRYFDELQPIAKWSTKGADDKGIYKNPGSWQILAGEDERKHQNWLRRVSGVQRYDISTAKGKRITSGLHTYVEHSR